MEEELLKLIKSDDEKDINHYLVENEKNIDWNKIWNKIIIPELKNGCENYVLGWMYQDGAGIAQDYQKAREHYELATKQDNSSAQNNLGLMYVRELGVMQDFQKAREYFEMAASKNFDKALYNLGTMYQDGLGVAQDYQKAREYYELAVKANQDFRKAQYNLGYLYEYGMGVEKDYEKALYYYGLCGANHSAIQIILDKDKDIIINLFKKMGKLEIRNRELEKENQRLEEELSCIPEYGDAYFKAKEHFEEKKN